MSEPKFTKGPWQTDDLVVCDSQNTQIASCLYDWMLSDDDDVILDNTKANAALIAAAPEMYELLQDIATNYQCMPNPYGVEQRIETVLKKARGEK